MIREADERAALGFLVMMSVFHDEERNGLLMVHVQPSSKTREGEVSIAWCVLAEGAWN